MFSYEWVLWCIAPSPVARVDYSAWNLVIFQFMRVLSLHLCFEERALQLHIYYIVSSMVRSIKMGRYFKVEPVSFSIILTQKQQEKKERGKIKKKTHTEKPSLHDTYSVLWDTVLSSVGYETERERLGREKEQVSKEK